VSDEMYKISFYVPETHLEPVKEALFKAGAGKIGNYDRCAWQTKGEGQFRPNEGAEPFAGQIDQLEKAEEYLVELVCDNNLIESVIRAFKNAHPYEQPAYSVVKCENY